MYLWTKLQSMETRKVQLTGGSTYTVSLPKQWATENDVDAGSEVEFRREADSLLLSPRREEGNVEGALDITDLTGDRLTRAVMTMYVSGFDVITLQGDGITGDQRTAVRDAAQGLVGIEIIEETSDHVVIQDLLDSSELSIHNAVNRMRLIATSMLEDAVTALLDNDEQLAESVVDRDDDVDRLYFVVSRIFRATLRSPHATEELGLPRETCFDYHSSARQLERIADHAAKISRLSIDLGDVPDDVTEALSALYDEISAIVETAMDALFAEDPEDATALAHQTSESIRSVDEHAKRIDELLRTLDPRQAQALGLVVDSLSRSGDYGRNIAETALQKAAPTPADGG
jgi:phosphate uptake regulator